jgi:hypothetical protein
MRQGNFYLVQAPGTMTAGNAKPPARVAVGAISWAPGNIAGGRLRKRPAPRAIVAGDKQVPRIVYKIPPYLR